MTTATHPPEPSEGFDFYDTDPASHADGHHETGTMLGFWIYLMSDSLIFGILFAIYAVLGTNYAAGPAPSDLFEIEKILLATFFLLFSSITYGFAVINMQLGKQGVMTIWLLVTGAFGIGFLTMEVLEFHHLWHLGAGPGASAFLSSFWFLVGTHGLHVLSGTIWLAVLLVQVQKHGLNHDNKRRILCLSLFWHFLDLIWIGVFSFVYLTGVLL
ncbi:cytochrome o ubiquinol oxidase subunit III [Pseudosulfitobacter pseudonitzschiae]|uniref:Cytochrome bo(3) ubiquinol oxidase subunit 3 n=1 Tax=Pseudosulfitobacter pseudonitzschiae TaxID=1402135 RepID=A0A073IWL3_9RHOB|nr:cytochrome o ubiquinol oxidase subunit III [Pseudosulfitobacter pseudonitzschiae]KEJ93856.1 cytochrome o ubiquinol oxidase subunit III [Pseudosulfitobacter pseudonitzschiae]MBM1817932.1 cytochrome o ubiquinol oxidase subunit III [Pseudosulfitobacter pseudonitzschiae]MBM1834990.1 cytochrome o ubiquinol oxidase subunit III [Pseudosulfitobacter pseudonitzschiae]MBM1839791.1 cytochrome o ubiquinol oxidase subunit III [Pseudosulfitobacter pseudonitzschiae]MBM1844705.1 cytochrome o ubiquinol oxid